MADDAFFSLLTETKINLGVCISHSWFDFESCMLKLVEGDPISTVIGGKEVERHETEVPMLSPSVSKFAKLEELLNKCLLSSFNYVTLNFSDYGTTKEVSSLQLAVMVGQRDVITLLMNHDGEIKHHEAALETARKYNRPKCTDILINSPKLKVPPSFFISLVNSGIESLNSPGYLAVLLGNRTISVRMRNLCTDPGEMNLLRRSAPGIKLI